MDTALLLFLVAVAAWGAGFATRDLIDRIHELKQRMPIPKKAPEQKKSTIVEAETPEQEALRRHRERIQQLNPGAKV